MTLAHAQATGSISIASTYVSRSMFNVIIAIPNSTFNSSSSFKYSLLRQWTEYLVVHALSPDAQYVYWPFESFKTDLTFSTEPRLKRMESHTQIKQTLP